MCRYLSAELNGVEQGSTMCGLCSEWTVNWEGTEFGVGLRKNDHSQKAKKKKQKEKKEANRKCVFWSRRGVE